MRTGIHIILRCFWMTRRNICADFDEQLDLVEELYGQRIQFFYGNKKQSEDDSPASKAEIQVFICGQGLTNHLPVV